MSNVLTISILFCSIKRRQSQSDLRLSYQQALEITLRYKTVRLADSIPGENTDMYVATEATTAAGVNLHDETTSGVDRVSTDNAGPSGSKLW